MYNSKSMKVLLLQDDKKLGKKGDVVNVAEGFAFNSLIPQGKAKVVTKATLAELERQKAREEKERAQKKAQMQQEANKLNKKKITIEQQAKGNKLFGSVTQKDIAQAIKEQQAIMIEETMIVLDSPIKELTTKEVVVDYGDGVTAGVVVTVTAK
jgi:large subunit ribosomal protein L9